MILFYTDLNSSLTTVTGVLGTDYGAPGVNSYLSSYLSRKDDLKELRLSWTFTSKISANTNYPIMTISNEDFRPSKSYQKFVVLANGITAWLNWNSDDNKMYIKPYSDVPANEYMHINETYF